MPLPLILGVAAGAAALTGIGLGAKGAMDAKDANDRVERVKRRGEENKKRHKEADEEAIEAMDTLGENELDVLTGFEEFCDLFERIKNRPEFKKINKDVTIPKFDIEEIRDVSVGAVTLVGGLSGAALGTAGAFAASGATTAAVTALGVASTGTAISSLSGAAATNAALATLGGGTLAAGGGGVALGTTILGASTLGVGLLVGGIIFNITGSKLSDRADKAEKEIEEKTDKICDYLYELKETAEEYNDTLLEAHSLYEEKLDEMRDIIENHESSTGEADWRKFSQEECLIVENTILLVGVLYAMCKVKLVLKSKRDDGINKINKVAIKKAEKAAEKAIEKVMAA